MVTLNLTERVFAAAREEGFDHCAAAPIQSLAAAGRLQQWLTAQMHGSMAWLARDPKRRSDPTRVVPEARTVLVVARNYYTGHPATEDPVTARISRYARGDEYHGILGNARSEEPTSELQSRRNFVCRLLL